MAEYKKENYVDPVHFHNLLVKLRADENNQELFEEVCIIFAKITKKVLTRGNFVRYPTHQKEDMFQEAMLDMIKHWRVYNPDHPKANVFAFFSQAAFNAFRQEIKNYKKRDRFFKVDNSIGLESLREVDEE